MRTSRAKWIALALCLGVCLPPVAVAQQGDQPAATPADILTAVPGDAWAALCIRNMGELDRKLYTLSQQLNVPYTSLLQMAKQSIGVAAGVNDNGGMAVVLLSMPNFMDLMPGIAVIVPCSDYNALVNTLQPQDFEGDIKKIMLLGHESYIAPHGAFAVIAQSPDPIKRINAAQGNARAAWSGPELEHYSADDISLWINAAAITSSEAFQAMMPMIAMMSQGGASPEEIKALRAVTVSLRLDKSGLKLGIYSGVKESTPQAALFATLPATDKSLLGGLPGGNYVLAFGTETSKEGAAKSAQAIAALLANPMVMRSVDPQKVGELKSAITDIMANYRSVAVSIAALPSGPDGIVGLTKVLTMDGGAKATSEKFGTIISLLTSGLITDPQVQQQISQIVQYRTGAETIGGASVDQIYVDVSKVPDSKPEWIDQLKKIIGQEGILVRIAAIDEAHIAATLGGGQARMQKVIELVKSQSAPLSADAGVKKAAAELPNKRDLEGYLSIGQLMTTAAEISKIVNEPPPPALPGVATPIAVIGGPVGKTGYQVDILAPADLIVAFKDVMMSQNVGAAPPPPAAEPPKPGD